MPTAIEFVAALIAAGALLAAGIYAYQRWRQDRHLDALQAQYERQRRQAGQ